jgi:hypothetical protein
MPTTIKPIQETSSGRRSKTEKLRIAGFAGRKDGKGKSTTVPLFPLLSESCNLQSAISS